MSLRKTLLVSALAVGSLSTTSSAIASSNPFIGEIMPTGYTFCPRGWANTDGQLLAIAQYQALFSLLGTTYGGDGRTTFALPDLRSRVPMHLGTGPGLSTRVLGQKLGTETNTMTVNQMPSHTHTAGIQTTNVAANATTPRRNAFGNTADNTYVNGAVPQGRFMENSTLRILNTGGSQPQNNIQPSLVLRYCISLEGIYPSRS